MHETFVGREGELAALAGALGAPPAVALVVGEAGIGKSRLVAEALERSGTDVRVLRSEALEHDQRPFELWRPIGRALHVPPPDPGLPAAERRWELVEQLAEAIRGAGPAAVVLEDLHWADDVDLWVLERLVRELRGVPVAVVATSRPDPAGPGRLAPLRRLAAVVELGGLDADAVADLVRASGSDHAPGAADLLERTGGNPLFLREVLAAGGGLPAAVSEVLAGSLDRLPAPVQEVVLAVAAAGSATPPAVIADALDLTPLELEDRLGQAVAAGALRPAPGRLPEPHHALLGEAALARASATDRCRLHLRLAEAWAGSFPSPIGRAESATHRLEAMPLVDAVDGAEAAVAAVEGLHAAGDARRVVGLARSALDALAASVPATRLARVRLAVLLGAGLDEVGEGVAARDAYGLAAELLEPGDDPQLQAEVAFGTAVWANPFAPHVELLQRLRVAEAALPEGDSRLRAQLLGRIAVLQCSSPGGPAASRAEGDRAVAVARRLEDPEVLVQVLVDRHLVPVGPADHDERGRAGVEIAAVGERLGRADLAFLGHEIVFEDRLGSGDRDGADDALARLEAYAQVLPSPRWRWTALVRRAEWLTVAGDHDGLLRAIEASSAAAEGVGDDLEIRGVEQGMRAATSLLWRIHDPVLAADHPGLVAASEHIPAPFIRIMVGYSNWALGDLDAARPVVERFAPRPGLVLDGMQGLFGTAVLAGMAAELGAVDHAPALLAALAPFGGRMGVHSLQLSSTLGRLALLLGDVEGSLEHHERAVEQATRLRSPTLLAWAEHHRATALLAAGDTTGAAGARARAEASAARCGVRLPAPPDGLAAGGPPPAAPTSHGASRVASLRRAGAVWEVRCPHGDAVLPHSSGLEQLALVLAAGGAEVAATTLAGMDASGTPVAGDLGPALDATAKRQYRARITELREDIDDAEAANDLDRAALAQLELDALLQQLSAAVGLGGRDRPTGAGAERARVNVTRNVRRAIGVVAAELPALGDHLGRSVRTGRGCAYEPEPATALTWEIST